MAAGSEMSLLPAFRFGSIGAKKYNPLYNLQSMPRMNERDTLGAEERR